MDIPKIFWKYYDLYRRKLITFSDFMVLSGINRELLCKYLSHIGENRE